MHLLNKKMLWGLRERLWKAGRNSLKTQYFIVNIEASLFSYLVWYHFSFGMVYRVPCKFKFKIILHAKNEVSDSDAACMWNVYCDNLFSCILQLDVHFNKLPFFICLSVLEVLHFHIYGLFWSLYHRQNIHITRFPS